LIFLPFGWLLQPINASFDHIGLAHRTQKGHADRRKSNSESSSRAELIGVKLKPDHGLKSSAASSLC
jgi:hypothetical protein